ncbi:MAG: PAC2 family protein [bacterium]|nr:PAC2 family protein [bacterium]MCP4968091.1 PAC2 family protein [bacterium]
MDDLYEIIAEPKLREPALILALSGWVDAGGSGTAAADFLAKDGDELVRFNGDAIFDYRANRPTVRFREGRMTEVEWPGITIHRRALAERDLLVMVGTEPDYRWKAFGEGVADLMERFGIGLIITIGAVPAAVPHTYPPPVMMTASTDELVGSDDVALGDDLDVPGAAVNVVADAAVRRGVGTIGYWAQIPHYVNERYHAGGLALLRRIAVRLDLDLDLTEVVEAADEQATQINELIATRPENEAHVQKLELLAEEGRLASGDELAAEIERFLADD